MVNEYDNNSPKYSRGYAEPETNRYNQNANYEAPKSTGFADSLENQFYFDRPATRVATENKREQRVESGNDGYNNGQSYVYNERRAEAPKASNTAPSYEQRQVQFESADPTYFDYGEQERQQNLNARYQKPARNYEEYDKQKMTYTTDDDTAPSPTTMQYSSVETGDNPFEDYHKKGEPVDKQYTINTKGKILIAVYALVVATVFALIILNTRLLKTMNASMVAKQMQITRLTREVNDLQSEYEYVSSDEVIEKKAEEKGMVKA